MKTPEWNTKDPREELAEHHVDSARICVWEAERLHLYHVWIGEGDWRVEKLERTYTAEDKWPDLPWFFISSPYHPSF